MSEPTFCRTRLEARLAVFVDGCFWHACPKHSNVPASHRAFWKRKLAANQARDRLVNRTLRKSGWRVVRIWEHDLPKRGEACVRRIEVALRNHCVRRRQHGCPAGRRSLLSRLQAGVRGIAGNPACRIAPNGGQGRHRKRVQESKQKH